MKERVERGRTEGASIGLRASVAVAVIALAATGCNPQELAQQAGSTTWLSVATGGTGGVYYPYGGGIAKVISDHLEDVEATAEVTAGTVDNLKFLNDRSADIAFALADSLSDAVAGEGIFSEFGRVPARSLAVLYSNYTHIATLADTGVERISDLRGRVVSTGAPGSGTEIIAFRVLEAAGLDPNADVTRQSLGASQSVDALKDGKIDAFFWSGGLPTGAVLDLATTPRMTLRLVPSDDVLPALQAKYGDTVYHEVIVPQSAYPDLEADVPVVGVANVLAVHESMPDDLAYDIIRVLFERRSELAAIHAEAENLTLESAVVGSPTPYHAGAIRYYEDQSAWADTDEP
ncbi:MAG: TAXI family TRAP transporter solute-binding subunit [Vicinamibacterales bacterium]|nr:TAXI family TRAP transporter solute-binding subunit [Vicinamibacterales bacterium]MDP6610518.1 TAXI family TRAP transporter solute-binding subunit [Vicinamibacterales bacterium]